ncbi:unnamed protein product, partial [Owenia fusiformis]
GVLPSTYLMRNLKEPQLRLNYLYLKGQGAKALADGLKVHLGIHHLRSWLGEYVLLYTYIYMYKELKALYMISNGLVFTKDYFNMGQHLFQSIEVGPCSRR